MVTGPTDFTYKHPLYILKSGFVKINDGMFREYDVRGKFGRGGLNKKTALLLGKGTGTYFIKKGLKKVALGHDNRKSSPELRKYFLEGLLSTGCNVLDIGMAPTPVLYFSIIKYKMDAGCMITGSHIPADSNGLKISIGFLSIYGKELQKIKNIIKKGHFEKGKGRLDIIDPKEDYIRDLRNRVKLKKKIKTVVDCGNGLAGLTAPRLMREVGAEVVVLFGDSDGDFPHHLPDSNKIECLQKLIEEVKRIKADIGIAFDGDTDRITAVDRNGDVILGDFLLALFFDEIKKKHRIKKVVADIKCSQAVIDEIKKHGGEVILCRTGHSIVEEKMLEYHTLLGAEVSGHLFFRDQYYGFDDAIYASLRLLRLLSEKRDDIVKILKKLPKYYTSREYRLICPDKRKFRIVEEIKTHFKDIYDVIETDGARVLFKGGWGLIRASNTQAELSVRFESKTKKDFEKIKKILNDELKKYPEIKGHLVGD